MITMAESAPSREWTLRDAASPAKGGRVVVLSGDWIARDGVAPLPDLAGVSAVSYDAAGLGAWDSALLVFVLAIRERARAADLTPDETGLPPAVAQLLSLTSAPSALPVPPETVGLAARVGRSTIALWTEALEVMTLLGESLLRGWAAIRGRARMRGVDLLVCLHEAGVAALPIVTIVNLLVGGILAFVGAVQLRKFGADIYIANLVGVAMTREMAALMTAIVMSGRTGGAYAAHIATMQGNEEIDALRAIGIPVHDYLILPRILALTAMMPLLCLYGAAVGILGGFAVSVSMLNLSPEAFIEQTRQSVTGGEILFGLLKSVTFGLLIAIAGCRSGIKAKRSAADVGKAATTAVVIGIVGVIALDAVFAICANALDF